MEQFEKLFGYPVGKRYADRLEYRGVGDLDKAVKQARELIKANDFTLRVISDGTLASMRAFIVEKI